MRRRAIPQKVVRGRIWRLIELFDGHGVKATIFTPGLIFELYPQARRAAVESGHEIADHGDRPMGAVR